MRVRVWFWADNGITPASDGRETPGPLSLEGERLWLVGVAVPEVRAGE